jgi:hypothetical protein
VIQWDILVLLVRQHSIYHDGERGSVMAGVLGPGLDTVFDRGGRLLLQYPFEAWVILNGLCAHSITDGRYPDTLALS